MARGDAARIEPLEGTRTNLSIRTIVAGPADYHQTMAEALAGDEVSLVDRVETEEALFDRLNREEFDCLIADYTFAGRNTLELRERIESSVSNPPATVIFTADDNARMVLKAFRNGVSDVVTGNQPRDLMAAVRRAVTRLRKTRALHDEIHHLARLARYDRLTGVPNQNHLEDRLAALIASAERHDRPFSILLIDINKFTAINDVYGHGVGDQVLKAFARKLMEASRSSDAFGRYGGDEFLYLIDQEVTPSALEQACARLVGALSFTVDLDNVAVNLSASVGAASYPADGKTTEALLRVAEEDMLDAKVAGTGYVSRDPGVATAAAAASSRAERPEAPVVREDNRRSEHRERVLRRGRIVLGDGYSTIDCLVRDISPHGARVTVQEGLAVPHNFNFRMLDTGRAYAAVRRWQRGLSIGLEFMIEEDEDEPVERVDKVA